MRLSIWRTGPVGGNKMRVLLIYPDTDPLSIVPHRLINIEPLALEYLAAAIPNHDVQILDMKTDHHLDYSLEKFRPDIVGITGTVIHTYRIYEILRQIKKWNPQIMTIVGGTQATLVPRDFDRPQVDFVAIGHGVDSFHQIVDNHEMGRSYLEIENIAFRHNGQFHINPQRPLLNLDSFPLPRRDLTDRNRNNYFHLVWRPTALIITSVGCSYHCNFCPCPVLTQGKYLKRSPELVLRELLEIKEKYIYAGDDNLFFDYKHAFRIYELLKEAGLKKEYYILSRIDEINRHPDLVEKWAKIGLKKVFLGLETFRDDELNLLNKRSTVENNNRAISILQANKIDPLGAFIIQPYYTQKDFDSLLRYMDRMKIYYHEFTVLTPFPGTDFYNKVKNQMLYSDYRLFDLAHSLFPTAVPVQEFHRLLSRLYRRALSPARAIRIRPAVSPFHHLRFIRLIPGLFSLFKNGRHAFAALRGVSRNPQRD